MLAVGEEVAVHPGSRGEGVEVERLRLVEHLGTGGQGAV
jgi:hypothetical protein